MHTPPPAFSEYLTPSSVPVLPRHCNGKQRHSEQPLALLVPARNTLERLTAEDPGNAQWQRGLVVPCYKPATSAEQGGRSSDASGYWRTCLGVLRRMKAEGMYLDPPLVQLFSQLPCAFK